MTTFLPLVGILLAMGLVWSLGYLQGRETEGRQKTPASYSQAAKADAQRACAGTEPTALFECVYEKVEASQEQARGEQDLSAQQRAASSALASAVVAFLTLAITGIGVWFVKRTLDATWRAVDQTESGTAAALIAAKASADANKIAVKTHETATRPYVFVDIVDHSPIQPRGAEEPFFVKESFAITLSVKNFGSSPAIITDCRADIKLLPGLGEMNLDYSWLPVPDKTVTTLGPTDDRMIPLEATHNFGLEYRDDYPVTLREMGRREFREFRREQTSFWVYGIVRYEGSGGAKYETRFCYRLHFTQKFPERTGPPGANLRT